MEAVLLHQGEDQVEHLVAFFSKLTPACRNYSVAEQELLGVLLALQHLEVYMPCQESVLRIYSDYHALQFLNNLKLKNERLTRVEFFTSRV